MFESMKDILIELSKEEQVESQKILSEILSGLFRGSKHWRYSNILVIREFIKSLFNQTIQVTNSKNWKNSIYYFSSNFDFKRVEWLFNHFQNKFYQLLNQTNLNNVQLIRITNFLIYFYAYFTWRIPNKYFNILEFIVNHQNLVHISLQLRSKLSKLIDTILCIIFSLKINGKNCQIISDTINWENLIKIKNNLLDKILSTKCFGKTQNALPLDENQLQIQQQQRNKEIHLILMIFYRQTLENNIKRSIGLLHEFLPMIFMLTDDKNMDLANIAHAVTYKLSFTEFTQESVYKIFNYALQLLSSQKYEITSGSSDTWLGIPIPIRPDTQASSGELVKEDKKYFTIQWRMKCAILKFFHCFIIRNIFFLSESDIKKSLDCLISTMGANEIQIRTSSCALLSTILVLLPHEFHISLWSQFSASAKQANIPLIGLHKAILGMAAIVNAHPFDLPPWLAPCLLEFATYINARAPVKVPFPFLLLFLLSFFFTVPILLLLLLLRLRPFINSPRLFVNFLRPNPSLIFYVPSLMRGISHPRSLLHQISFNSSASKFLSKIILDASMDQFSHSLFFPFFFLFYFLLL